MSGCKMKLTMKTTSDEEKTLNYSQVFPSIYNFISSIFLPEYNWVGKLHSRMKLFTLLFNFQFNYRDSIVELVLASQQTKVANSYFRIQIYVSFCYELLLLTILSHWNAIFSFMESWNKSLQEIFSARSQHLATQ